MDDERRDMIRRNFEQIVDGTPYAQKTGADAVMKLASPDEFAEIALQSCTENGYEGYMLAASWIFHRFGLAGWNVLRRLIERRPKDTVQFIWIVTHFDGITIAEKLAVLAEWAAKLDPETAEKEFSWLESCG